MDITGTSTRCFRIKVIFSLLTLRSSSAFLIQSNPSKGHFKGDTLVSFQTPFVRDLHKSQFANVHNLFFPSTTRKLFPSTFEVSNKTDDTPYLHEINDFEQDAIEQIRKLEALLNDSGNDTDKGIPQIEQNLDEFACTHKSEELSQQRLTSVISQTSQSKYPSFGFLQNFNPFKNDPNKELITARALLIGAAALYGTNFALVKILDEHVPVGASTSLRFGLAALATMSWLVPSQNAADDSKIIDNAAKSALSWGPIFAGMEIGFWNSVGYIAQAVGLATIDASKSAFICSLAVIFVPILDASQGKTISMRKLGGISMAVSGVALLEFGQALSSISSGEPFPTLAAGDLISFLQPLAFGIGFWRMEHATEKYPKDARCLTAAQLLAVALASITYCACGGGGVTPPTLLQISDWLSNVEILSALVWTGIVTTALTIYMETVALKTVSAAEATLILSTEPIWGSAFAALVVGERLGVEAGIGAAMILGGCLFSSLDQNRHSDIETEELDILKGTNSEEDMNSAVKSVTNIDVHP